MNIIEELYYGNIRPCEKSIRSGSQYAKALERFCKIEEKLGKELKGKKLKLFYEAVNTFNEMTACAEFESFRTGFVLGARMMNESFDKNAIENMI